MKKNQFRFLITALFATLLLVFTHPSFAKTNSPIQMILSGGYTMNSGVSESTQLFIDRNTNGQASRFWVQVEADPGTPEVFDIEISPEGEQILPVAEPTTIYIKYFALSRYVEVRRALGDVQTYGVVNPYLDGNVICDGHNTEIRFRKNTVLMAYNCGGGDSFADEATFTSETLLKALRDETIVNPDLQGQIPE